jgi:hypothetical protein
MKCLRLKVHRLPLEELWDEDGKFGTKVRDLAFKELNSILQTSSVHFVEANVGSPLKWIPLEDCHRFWQSVRPNIAKSDEIPLDDYPQGFAYGPSEWLGRSGERIIVLEMYH